MDYDGNRYMDLLLGCIQVETSRRPPTRARNKPTSEVDGMTDFINTVEQALAVFKRKRNSLLLVDALPTELMAAILEWAVSGDVRKRYVELQRFRLVCSSWTATIDATPALWSVLSSHHSWRVQEIALRRSSNHPLSVWHDVPSVSQRIYVIGTPRFLQPSSIQRWKFASLEFGSRAFLATLNHAAPLLEVLRLQAVSGSDDDHWTEDLFPGEMPRLQEIRLQAVAVPWESRYFAGLRILELSCIQHRGPTIPQLFSILSQCPELSTAVLDRVAFPSGDSANQTTIPLALPNLTRLQLTHLTSVSTHQIVTNLDFPRLLKFDLQCSMFRKGPSTLFDHQLYQTCPAFVRLLQNARAMRIEVQADMLTCRALFPKDLATARSFAVTIRSCPSASPLRWLLSILKDVTPHLPAELTVSGFFPFAHDEEFFEIMLQIPHLVDISFKLPNEDIAILLARLGAYSVDEDGEVKWTLPDLNILCLSGDYFDDSEVLAMVKSRYGLSKSQNKAKNHLPAPFVLLDVVDNTRSTEETLAEIRSIVGDSVLEWEEFSE